MLWMQCYKQSSYTCLQGRIKFVNIASMAYDPAENEGILYEEAMEVRLTITLRDGVWRVVLWVVVAGAEGVLCEEAMEMGWWTG